MPKCFKCLLVINNFSLFRTHIRRHGFERASSVECAEDGCGADPFSNMNNLIRHYKDVHKMTEQDERGVQVEPDQVQNVEMHVDPEEPDPPEEPAHFLEDDPPENEQNYTSMLKEELNLFIANLYSNPKVPRNQVQNIVEYAQSLVTAITCTLKPFFLQLARSSDDDQVIRKLNDCFQVLDNPFHGVHSEYFRIKTFTDAGTFIPPEGCTIGEEVQAATVSGTTRPITAPVTAQFIPLRLMLKAFLEEPGVMKIVKQCKDSLDHESVFLTNVVHGEVWKKSFSSSDKFIFPLFLASDGFECGDGFGDMKNIHNITGVYVNLPFLPQHFLSNLDNIFVIFLHHSSDKHAKDLYKRVIEEFKFLYEEGVSVKCEDYDGQVYFALSLLTGDNLGLHTITGFSECFTANYPCLMCKVHRTVMRRQCKEDVSLRRDEDNYLADVNADDLSKTGVREYCDFNELETFHCSRNVCQDIMHDILEGVCEFDLTVVIDHCLSEGFFDLGFLNNRIKFFDYGKIDSNSKPPLLSMDKGGNVKIQMSASHMLTFVKYFGLIIGDKIPEGDPFWQLYILLRRIIDYIMRPIFPKEHLPILQALIEKHHQLYLDLSPDKHLKPKHHHMLHFVWCIEKHGPLLHQWAMRNESKNKVAKTMATSICTRRNLTLSLAMRFQFAFHSKLRLHSFLNKKFKSGPSRSCSIQNIEFYEQVRLQVPDHLQNVEIVPWVNVKGTTFKNQMVLVRGYSDFLPVFSRIEKIILNSCEVYFFCSELKTEYFDEHYFGYKVSSIRNSFCFLKLDSLPHPFPTDISSSGLGKLFAIYKYGL